MGNDDWGSPGWGSPGQTGNPWRPEEPAPSVAGGLATGVVLTVVAVVVLVVAVVAVGMWLWSNQGDGDDTAAPAFTTVPVQTPATTPGTAGTAQSPSTSPSPTPARPSPERTTRPSDPSDVPSTLGAQGWRGVRAATCNASDRWVFAGTNGEDHAVVCRVGERGDLYYRGYYNNRSAEYDIDMQRAGSGRWVTRTLDNNGSRVVISGTGVRVVDGGGDTVSSRGFTWSSEGVDR